MIHCWLLCNQISIDNIYLLGLLNEKKRFFIMWHGQPQTLLNQPQKQSLKQNTQACTTFQYNVEGRPQTIHHQGFSVPCQTNRVLFYWPHGGRDQQMAIWHDIPTLCNTTCEVWVRVCTRMLSQCFCVHRCVFSYWYHKAWETETRESKSTSTCLK